MVVAEASKAAEELQRNTEKYKRGRTGRYGRRPRAKERTAAQKGCKIAPYILYSTGSSADLPGKYEYVAGDCFPTGPDVVVLGGARPHTMTALKRAAQ